MIGNKMEYNEFTQNKDFIYSSRECESYKGESEWIRCLNKIFYDDNIDILKNTVSVLELWMSYDELSIKYKKTNGNNFFIGDKKLIYYSNDRGMYKGGIKTSRYSVKGLSKDSINFIKDAVGILQIWSDGDEFIVVEKDLKGESLFIDGKKLIYKSNDYKRYNKISEWYGIDNFNEVSIYEIKKFKKNKNILGLWVGNNELVIMAKLGSKLDDK